LPIPTRHAHIVQECIVKVATSSSHDRHGIAELDDTIGLIYEAALDPALWSGARWRLKQVLAKTDTHRQVDLVRLLLTSAVLGGDAIDTSLTSGRS